MTRQLLTVLMTLAVYAIPAELVLAQVRSGTIAGTVVTTDAPPQPITRAIVTLSGGNIPDNVSTVTDPSGRFQFTNLTPGRYVIGVTKAAHLPTQYGATRPGRPGTSIALAPGQNLDLRIPLPRGAVITGTVRDQFGTPAPGIRVTVSPATMVTNATGFPADSVLVTDDRGNYRAYGLMPDEYVVSAVPRTIGNGEVTSLSLAEFEARMRALEQRSTGTPQANPDAGREPERLGFAPTFHPGTTISSDAARVRIGAGEERAGVDVALTPVRAARVSGTIHSGDVPVQRLRPSLSVIGPPQPGIVSPSLAGPNADGVFSFSNVTPGRYALLVRSGPGAPMALTDGRTGTTTDNPDVAPRFAYADLDVNGADITGVVLTLRPSLSLSGRVEFQGATKPPANFAGVSLTIAAPGGPMPIILNGAPVGATGPARAQVREDGTFQAVGIIPGTYTVTATVPAGWRLRSVVVNGRDVLDHRLQVDGASTDISDAVVTFVDARSELGGTLTTVFGQPATEFTVLAFPVDRGYWRPGARRIKTVRPASDGAFSIMDLPAGEYLLAALTDVDPRDLQDSAFLEQIVGAAVKIIITDGQKTRQDLRIAR